MSIFGMHLKSFCCWHGSEGGQQQPLVQQRSVVPARHWPLATL
jgi:hypothetical protein